MKFTVLFSSIFIAINSYALQMESPFAGRLDLKEVVEVLKTKPENLVSKIKSYGIDVKLFPLEKDKGQVKLAPFLRGVERISTEQRASLDLEEMDFQSSEGVFISNENTIVKLKEDTIFVSDNVQPLTLVHEFTHAIIHKNMDSKHQAIGGNAEKEITQAQRVFKFRFDKIFRNSYLVADKLWRRDLTTSMIEYAVAIENIMTYSLSEEIVIERALQGMVKPGSLYYDIGRLTDGEKYAQNKLEQIRVLIADLAFVVDWTKGEIETLAEESMELREKYYLQKLFKQLAEKAEELNGKYLLLKNLKVQAE